LGYLFIFVHASSFWRLNIPACDPTQGNQGNNQDSHANQPGGSVKFH
jgi:hypothetical protein